MLAHHLAQRRASDPLARTVVFSGHSHFFEHHAYRGVDFVVTGGAGAPSHRPSESPPTYRRLAYRGDHHVLVRVTEDHLDFRLEPVGPGRWIQEGGEGE